MGLILSSHLEKPITDKESSDECGEKLICGISSMQGWRETQEDAHNCCVNFDEETSLFAVYDGHGGHEVAEYCSENFPEFLKQTELYKEGKFEEAMRDAFLKFDALLTTEDVKAILKQKKLSRENVEEESVDVLKAESDIPIEELITRYQNKLKSTLEESCDSESASSSGAGSSKKSQPSTSEKEKETKIKEEESKDDKTETKMEQGQGDSSSSSSTSGEKTKEEEKELTEKKNDSETDEKIKEEKVELKTESNKETTNIKEEEKATEEKEKDSTKTTDEEKKVKESTEEKPKKALDKTKNCEVNGDISKSDKKMENGEVKSPRKLNKKFVNSLQAQALYHQLIYGSSDDDSNLDEDDEDDETFGENESTENGEKADAVEEDDDDDDDDENVDAEEEDDDDDEEEEDEEDDDDVEEEEEEEEGDEEDDDQEFHFDNVPGSSSGCTANVALLRGNTLYVANAGDSRCVVCRKGEAIEMSFDHKPESTIERTRIEKAGGHVSREGRVNNGLNLSRALGDHTYKQNKDLPAEEQMITALPDIKVLEMTPEDEFMVLACDGIWNSMSNQEVVDFIKERIDMKPEKLSKICEQLFDHCLTPDIYNSEDGAGCDNMTALIIQFKSSRNSTKRPASPKDENSSESKRIKSLSDDDKSPVATIAATDDKSSKATTTATQV